MRLRFWGTRGSIPQPDASMQRYGGNTSCVELRSDAGTLVVLDCGTGAHALGRALEAERDGPWNGHLLITHTHWDHIQGFPFFRPLFASGGRWDVYGPQGLGASVREALIGQLQYSYFPIIFDEPRLDVRFQSLVEGHLALDDIRVTTHFLNHPALTLGYRLEVDGVVVVYATDHEPHDPALAHGVGERLEGEDRRHAEFLQGADLLIHDAQYRAAEFPTKDGWGHSTLEYVVDIARIAGVQRVALFHHDPWRDDASLDELVAEAKARVDRTGSPMEVFGAAEGEVFELSRAQARSRRDEARQERPRPELAALRATAPALRSHGVLVAHAEDEPRRLLRTAAEASGFQVTEAEDGAAALRALQDAPPGAEPALALLDAGLAAPGGLEVCREIRAREADRPGPAIPVLLVGDRAQMDALRPAAREAGISGWLLRPLSEAYARTRIGAWALRGGASTAPRPEEDEERVRTLHGLALLDTPPEHRFDRITRMASRLLDVPLVGVSLVDEERQWFKSLYGMPAFGSMPRDASFCTHAILESDLLIIQDAFQDPRFRDNPFVLGAPHIRFYAGVPLRASNGAAVGSFCVIDRRPRELDEDDRRLLRDLASLAQVELQRAEASGDEKDEVAGPSEDDANVA